MTDAGLACTGTVCSDFCVASVALEVMSCCDDDFSVVTGWTVDERDVAAAHAGYLSMSLGESGLVVDTVVVPVY